MMFVWLSKHERNMLQVVLSHHIAMMNHEIDAGQKNWGIHMNFDEIKARRYSANIAKKLLRKIGRLRTVTTGHFYNGVEDACVGKKRFCREVERNG